MRSEDNPGRSMVTRSLVTVLAVAVGVLLLWASDRITLQGERTIYTVLCDGGTWNANACTGKLVPDKRYAFRASRSRHEVIYWVRGSGAPSGHFTGCTVVDRDNWKCDAVATSAPTIALEMANGRPVRGDGGRLLALHSVPKWKWWLLEAGVGGFREAGD